MGRCDEKAAYLDDLLVGHSSQKDMLLILVGVEFDDIGCLAVAKPLDALARLGIPKFHSSVIGTGQELTSVVGERDVLDGLDMTIERP